MRAMLHLLPALVLGLTDAPAQGGPGDLTPPPPPPSPRPAQAPAKPAAPARLPVPSLDERKQAEKLIRDLFKDEYAKRTAADRQDLATKLLASARRTKNDPAGLYVLLAEAAELAATTGDVKTAVAAVALLTRRFDVDAAKLRAETLDKARRAVRTPEAARELAGAYVVAAEEARIGEDYDGALALLKKAESVARSARDAAVLADIQGQAREIRDLQKESRKVQPSLAKLEKDPDDPAANLAVGRYWCFYRGQWDRGLPHLVKGSNARLRELAGLEQADPADAAGQQALGDAWWEAAKKESIRAAKGRLQARALHWYLKALQKLEGVALLSLEKKFEERQAAAGVQSIVDLLATVDPSKDTVRGRWEMENGVLAAKMPGAQIAFPYRLPKEYDLHVDIAVQGRDHEPFLLVGFALSGGKQIGLRLSGGRGRSSVGLMKLAGGANTSKQVMTFGPDNKAKLQIEVRTATVKIKLNGDPVLNWPVNASAVGTIQGWSVPVQGVPFLGANRSETSWYRFERIMLIPVTGVGRPLR